VKENQFLLLLDEMEKRGFSFSLFFSPFLSSPYFFSLSPSLIRDEGGRKHNIVVGSVSPFPPPPFFFFFSPSSLSLFLQVEEDEGGESDLLSSLFPPFSGLYFFLGRRKWGGCKWTSSPFFPFLFPPLLRRVFF